MNVFKKSFRQIYNFFFIQDNDIIFAWTLILLSFLFNKHIPATWSTIYLLGKSLYYIKNKTIKDIFQPSIIWLFVFSFFLASTYCYSSDKSTFYNSILLYFSFFAIQFSFILLSDKYYSLHRQLSNILMLSAWMYFGAFIVYFRLSDIEHTLLSGQSFLQAPFSHIRFNFIVFLAWFIGVVQLISFANKKKRILITITISSIYLVFLANRSVQLMFFLSLIFFFLELVKSSKRKSIFVLSGLGIFFIMIVCISQTEIWAYKLRFLIYQFEIFQSLDNRNFNDINRYYSILDGINLIKKNPAFGVGLGDIASEIKALNPDLSPTLPHNQFVYIWASAGFHSLFAFISFLIALLVQFKKNKNYYNLWMLFLILLFMMIEFPLQVQFGILFISLMIHFPYENYSRIHHL